MFIIQNPLIKKQKLKMLMAPYTIFKIQASRVDKVNGFKAMAVSPKDSKGNVDNETVYFVYAGTDKYEPADISTDIYLEYQ